MASEVPEDSKPYIENVGVSVRAYRPTQKESDWFIAIQREDLPLIRQFLDEGGNIDAEGGHALCLAAERNHIEIMKLLIERGANIAGHHSKIIATAVKSGHFEMVDFLLSLDEGAHSGKDVALTAAVIEGHVGMTARLLDRGADLQKHPTLIALPLQNRNDAMATFLLSRNDDLVTDSSTLHYAIHFGRPAITMELIARGADIHGIHRNNGAFLFTSLRDSKGTIEEKDEIAAQLIGVLANDAVIDAIRPSGLEAGEKSDMALLYESYKQKLETDLTRFRASLLPERVISMEKNLPSLRNLVVAGYAGALFESSIWSDPKGPAHARALYFALKAKFPQCRSPLEEIDTTWCAAEPVNSFVATIATKKGLDGKMR